MDNSYLTVAREGYGQYEEKKSIFYSFIAPIETEEEALEYIELERLARDNIRHLCYAYINRGGNVVRFSDDGEPQGTAGMPILEVLRREELVGVVCGVSRFFGGVLLGAGGLVRAYCKAAKLALDDAGKANFVEYGVLKLSFDYTYLSKIRHELAVMRIPESSCDFGERVTLEVTATEAEEEKVRNILADITSGKAIVKKTGSKFAPER
jgi:uncharacterized YigZ family protein